jgi:Putative Actinobacterial Holin-X, holin superfamily III
MTAPAAGRRRAMATATATTARTMLKRSDTIVPEADGIGDLVHRLVEDGKAYARAEVNVYKTIGTEKVASLRTPIILLVVAVFLAHAAFLALVATVFVGLAQVMQPALAGVVTVLFLAALAGITGYLGASKLTGGADEAEAKASS